MDLSRGWVEGLAVWGAGFPDVVSAVLKTLFAGDFSLNISSSL